MNFSINPLIFNHYPELQVGILIVKGANNSESHPEIEKILRAAEEELRNTEEIEPINQHPNIAIWREAHKRFGSKPKKYPPSIQALAKRVIKGGELPNINPLVDLYNTISLKYIIPAGGEDLDHCSENIELTFAEGHEEFFEIGSDTNKPPEAGEVVYKDNQGIICRRFNWREADRTKLTQETKNAVLVLEALPPTNKKTLEKALTELSELTKKFCQAETKMQILSKEAPSFSDEAS